MHTWFIEVPLQLHRRLHLHVVLEEAAAERGLVVGLLWRDRQTNNESSCSESVPSSRYCTGGCLLNCPWFSCFLTHHSAVKQARQLHPLTGSKWVLRLRKFTRSKLAWIKHHLFDKSLHWFTLGLQFSQRAVFPRKTAPSDINSVYIWYKLV